MMLSICLWLIKGCSVFISVSSSLSLLINHLVLFESTLKLRARNLWPPNTMWHTLTHAIVLHNLCIRKLSPNREGKRALTRAEIFFIRGINWDLPALVFQFSDLSKRCTVLNAVKPFYLIFFFVFLGSGEPITSKRRCTEQPPKRQYLGVSQVLHSTSLCGGHLEILRKWSKPLNSFKIFIRVMLEKYM